MSSDDYRRGLTGMPGSGVDHLAGRTEQLRRQDAARPASYQGEPAPSSPTSTGIDWSLVGQSAGATHAAPRVPETLQSMAKGGASLFAALFVAYTLLKGTAWTWPVLIGGGFGAALIGAIAGAALFITLKLLALALRVAAFLLIVGIVLHALDLINLPRTLTSIAHVFRR